MRRTTIFTLLVATFGAGCALEGIDHAEHSSALVASRGAADTLDFASWNIEWFGDTGNGPTNETLQRDNAWEVISGSDMDIWGVAEIGDSNHFDGLVAQLSGYDGLLANDASVIDGPAYYSGFNNTEQKVGLIYKSSLATVLDARIILTNKDYEFAGRPPMQVTLRVTLEGHTEDIVVIVLHAKCCTDSTSWTRRSNGSIALKSYLDSNYPTQKVWVIGDYNDDVDTSISSGRESPYANFVNDPADYTFPTKELSDAGFSSTVFYPDMVDHHLGTNESMAQYIAGSAEAYRVDQYIANYADTTSDHYPVLSRYTWGGGGGGGPTPTITVTTPNGGESWAGGSAQNITWTSSDVTNVSLEYSLDSGSTWTTITSSTGAAAGSYAWTVPASASSAALVRVSDTAGAASDTSDGVFAITTGGGGGGGSPAEIVVNEICANEPGSNTAGEFIELVNIGGTSADLGGWTFSDSVGTRHTFAAGTTLPAGQAIVVFGGASGIPGGVSNAVTASTGALGLNNGGDTVTLRDDSGATKFSYTYSSALSNKDGVSMNRDPDGDANGSFVRHNSISTLSRSAGTRASGAAW